MQDQKQTRKAGQIKFHHVRFYDLAPRAIQCLAYNKMVQKLSLARCDGSIEIWDVQYACCLEKIIHKPHGGFVEAMVWVGHRLFSASINGELIEWDLRLLVPRVTVSVTGNCIWCLDTNSLCTELAAGTEEGYINIYDIANNQIRYKQLFDRQEGRVICCKFDSTGEFLVTGSVNIIRIWDTFSGHALHKITLARLEMKKDVIVWSLQVLRNFTIICGDSRGQITFWDGRTASLLESHHVSKVDILTVKVNEEETLLMCSGVDPIIRIYAKADIKRENGEFCRWVKFLQRNVHDYDVKALDCMGERIISGGVDGYLGVSSTSKAISTIAKYGPFLQTPCAVTAPTPRLLLLRYPNYLEMWRLGSAWKTSPFRNDESENKYRFQKSVKKKPLVKETGPEKLLELKSKFEAPIVCATISPNGQWLCYSTNTEIRLFRVTISESFKDTSELSRVVDLPLQFQPASHLQFTSDSERLFLVNAKSQNILVFLIIPRHDNNVDFIEVIETGKYLKDVITLFTVSNCCCYAVAAGADRTIAIWRVFEGKHFKHFLNLPRHWATTTALAIHQHQPRLVISFSDGKISEYDLEEMCFTYNYLDRFVENVSTHYVSKIVLDVRNPSVFIMHNETNMFVLEKYSPNSIKDAEDDTITDTTGQRSKKPKQKNDEELYGLRTVSKKCFQNIIQLLWLNEEELVAVGVNPNSFIKQLPKALRRKIFASD